MDIADHTLTFANANPLDANAAATHQGDRPDGELWGVDIQRGPSWLFVRLSPGQTAPNDIAEDRVWSAADRHFIYRLVLEMDEVSLLPSQLMGQLVMLQKRALQHDGALRLSGLTDQCAHALHSCRLDRTLPNFPSREEAVAGECRKKTNLDEAFQTSCGM